MHIHRAWRRKFYSAASSSSLRDCSPPCNSGIVLFTLDAREKFSFVRELCGRTGALEVSFITFSFHSIISNSEFRSLRLERQSRDTCPLYPVYFSLLPRIPRLRSQRFPALNDTCNTEHVSKNREAFPFVLFVSASFHEFFTRQRVETWRPVRTLLSLHGYR